MREPRKPDPDYILSVPKQVPGDSEIRVEIYQYSRDYLLWDLRIDGEIEHTQRGGVYDIHLYLDDRATLDDHARSYLRYHADHTLILSDGEIDRVEELLGAAAGNPPERER